MNLNEILLEAVNSGSVQSKQKFLASCYEELFEKIYALTRYLTPLDAEDVTSDIFRKIFELNLPSLLSHAEHLEGYLLVLARNHCHTVNRLGKRRQVMGNIEDAIAISSNPLQKVDSQMDFSKAINSITLKQREVIQLMLAGYNYEEIAEKLDTSVGAIKNLVYRGKDGIRKFYDEPTIVPEHHNSP